MEQKRIYVSGHRGMVGSAIVRALQERGCEHLIVRTSDELDLRDQAAVNEFFRGANIDLVFFAAARVGGIYANDSQPAEFLYDNLLMASNAIDAAWRNEVERFLFLGSTCIYPRLAEQPIAESSLLSGPLEPTNEAYALAKIVGLKLCQFYRRQYGVLFHSAMPTNLYGPGDNYHPEHSHVLPALLRRFHEAKMTGADSVTIWGSGKPLREFLHVDDLAAGLVHLVSVSDPPDWVNIGSGEEISIHDLAQRIADTVQFEGTIKHDLSKPDGTPRKLCDSQLIRQTGWKPQIDLDSGLKMTYDAFLQETKALELRSK